MKKFKMTLSGVLLATSAMIAPGLAFAQTETAPTQQTPAEQAEPATVDEIVVLGRYIPEPNRESSEVAAFLTSEDLERTGDSNAAAALTRVTGLSIVEGRFIYVRGLGERYSSALLNGSPLPSPEPLQRVVPLDLFPSSILDGVTVQKTYSPNFPGEFGGGVIDLHTIDAPADPFFTMKLSLGGNTESTGKENLIYYGSRTDFTGFDDDTREVPGQIAIAFDTGLQINRANFSADELQAMGQSLVNAPLRLLQREKTPIDGGLELAGGFSQDTGLGTLGVIAVAGYDNSWRAREGVQEEGQFQGEDLVPVSTYAVQSNQNDIRLNFLGGLSLSTDDHEVKWTNLYVRNTTKEARSTTTRARFRARSRSPSTPVCRSIAPTSAPTSCRPWASRWSMRRCGCCSARRPRSTADWNWPAASRRTPAWARWGSSRSPVTTTAGAPAKACRKRGSSRAKTWCRSRPMRSSRTRTTSA